MPTPKPDLPLARIHGWLSGDGHADARVEANKKSVHYELRFFPDVKYLAELYVLNFERRFQVEPHVYDTRHTEGCYTVRVRNVAACRFILSVGTLGHHTWRIPSFGHQEEYVQWIRSYYDCEARVYRAVKAIQTKSVNHQGLEQVHTRLNQFGIPSTLYGPYPQAKETWSPYWVLSVAGKSAIKAFALKIGFNHPMKQRVLMSIAGPPTAV